MTHRRYETPEVTIDVRGLGTEHGIRLNIEHRTGAALMVPRADSSDVDGATRIVTTGFDGTEFTIDIRDEAVTIRSNVPSAILGGIDQLDAPRVEVKKADLGPLRVTGDEETMPILVGDE
jgi:hypothetical protein